MTESKRCKDCETVYDIDNFSIHRHKRKSKKKGNYILVTTSSYCKTCDNKRNKLTQEKNRDKYNTKRRLDKLDPEVREFKNEQKRKRWKENPIPYMLIRAKRRAKLNGIEFDLEIEDITIPDLCPLLNIPFIPGEKGNYSSTPSLDKIDPNKGYTKDNVWVITMKANTMKSNATKDQLITFAEAILKHFKKI